MGDGSTLVEALVSSCRGGSGPEDDKVVGGVDVV